MIILPLIAALVQPQAAQPIYAKGGAIGLVPPPGMREASSFSGFESASTGASITLAELPAEAYGPIILKLDAGEELPNGLSFPGKGEPVELADGTKAVLLHGTQEVAGIKFAKWLLIAGGEAVTALVTAQVPEGAAEAQRATIEATLKSVVLRAPAKKEDALAALPFAIGEQAGFRVIRTLMGSGVILTEGPRDVDPDTTQPMVIVVSALRPIAPAQRAAAARQSFEAFGGMKDITVADESGDGDRNFRTAGTATTDKGKPITLIQHMRYTAGGGYLRTVCVAPKPMDIAERCDTLAGSVAPRGK